MRVAEIFNSLQGEGPEAGRITTFIRLQGCNFFPVSCHYCDTKYAQDPNGKCRNLSIEEICREVLRSRRICVTGGEPLMQDELLGLLAQLTIQGASIDLETNGSFSVQNIKHYLTTLLIVMDWKLPSSGMERFMKLSNFQELQTEDVVKFVCSDKEDYERAVEVMRELQHFKIYPKFYFHALGGTAEKWLVEAILEDKLWGVYFGIQLHKLLWGNKRGV